MSRVLVVLLAVGLGACRATLPDATLPPVALPELSDMEAPVRQQITAQFDTVTRLAREGAAAAALAPASGTLGSLLFAGIALMRWK